MVKTKELSDPLSCLNRAADDEILFVLLSRDLSAPVAIRAWVKDRVETGKNVLTDPQIQEALGCAFRMEQQRKKLKKKSASIPCRPPAS
jgi:hypothetical protein